MSLGVFPLGFILFGTLWISWTWMAISFPILGKFLTIISSIFSCPFFWSSSSGTSMIQILGHLTLSHRSLMLSSFVLILFSSFLSSFISTILSSTSLIFSSASVLLLLVPSRVLLNISYCFVHYWWTLFISYISLSLCLVYFSITTFCFHDFVSSLLSLFWILFKVDYLLLFCLVWWVFIMFLRLLNIICLFTLFRFLCLVCPFCRLEIRGSS